MKKNILLALMLILILFSLTACRIKPIEKIEEESSEQEIVLDLSEYDIVGEWSDGKAMVHKTESSYNYVEGSFAYIDTNGNVLGEWHSDKDWLYPADFCNDRALVYLGNNLDSRAMCDHGYDQKAYYVLIDEKGQERFAFAASLEYQPILNIMQVPDENRLFINREIHEFEENGYLFFKEKRCVWEGLDDDDSNTWPKSYLLIPDENEFVRLISFESYTDDIWNGEPLIVDYDLDCFGEEYVNGYLTYQNRYKANGSMFQDYLLFDLDGNIALDVAAYMDYSIWGISDVRDDLTFSVEFGGVDGNNYTVDMDLNGNWLTEPQQID